VYVVGMNPVLNFRDPDLKFSTRARARLIRHRNGFPPRVNMNLFSVQHTLKVWWNR
jgi:hypothetical protein